MQSRSDVRIERQEQLLGLRGDVQPRRCPYPYRCMLAICSDLDSTPDRHVYGEIMRFLNTTEATAMGRGMGLEVGNSIHFRARPPQFSYWDTDEAGRAMVHTLIHSGHIDCLHSFGERVHTREEAQRALGNLQEQECRLEVWVDHGSAATNFGPDVMDGHGDETGHPAYHADLTIDYGVKYVWCGRITSVVGQEARVSLGGIFNRRHPLASGRTLLKEGVKYGLARIGNEKYSMHGPNELLRRTTLRDGRHVYEFLRCNPHWGGVTSCDQGRHVGDVLTRNMLQRLVKRGGACILYTHLGKIDDPRVPFDRKAVAAFQHLAEEFDAGRILVTTTRRLLGYYRAVREMTYDVRKNRGILHIDVKTATPEPWAGALSPGDLAGTTFYVPESEIVRVTIDGRQVPNLKHNSSDHTGRPSVSLPWAPLQFPDL